MASSFLGKNSQPRQSHMPASGVAVYVYDKFSRPSRSEPLGFISVHYQHMASSFPRRFPEKGEPKCKSRPAVCGVYVYPLINYNVCQHTCSRLTQDDRLGKASPCVSSRTAFFGVYVNATLSRRPAASRIEKFLNFIMPYQHMVSSYPSRLLGQGKTMCIKAESFL